MVCGTSGPERDEGHHGEAAKATCSLCFIAFLHVFAFEDAREGGSTPISSPAKAEGGSKGSASALKVRFCPLFERGRLCRRHRGLYGGLCGGQEAGAAPKPLRDDRKRPQNLGSAVENGPKVLRNGGFA